ncbi:MAG: tRNA (N(6)-L-threonylcarbamoyladenosine(37)-C(2))-methylthiotransferase MtaB [Candidatus Omnitrophica bacterium]|nr:tRNA (N(6)-L-threonylcarbamoyladenosine(37)-C(2))-methylthiotransferase MtaB [Candidatus Omnitrophota bacterium]
MKTVKFYTLGCKANQYDTQEIREQFLRAGFSEAYNGCSAQVCVINTCTVTGKADADSLYTVRRARRENPRAKVIVTGCLTELDAPMIRKAEPLSIMVRNKDKKTIANRLFRYSRLFRRFRQTTKMNQTNITSPTNQRRQTNGGISFFEGHTRAFLKIQDGCNYCCSYCKVPLVRGRSCSKPLRAVVQEARRLVANGYKEIVLTGICLGAYGRDFKPSKNLGQVIEELEDIEGLLRIRFSSIEAKDISQGLIKKLAHSKKLCRHLHIPLQSGDDEILKKMRRHYTRQQFLVLVRRLKRAIPGIAITTDVLVGFPGENDRHFQNTVKAVKGIVPLQVHIFPYSRREDTSAACLESEEVPRALIRERTACIRAIAEACALRYKKRFLGKVVPVLIEGRVKDTLAYWEGHTDNYIKVYVKSHRDLDNQTLWSTLKSVQGGYVMAS